MTNHETRALRAVLTVTVETRSDGGHYFDQADFTAHVAEWVRSSLRNKHAVGDVAVVEAAAVSVPPPAPRADASCVCGEPEAPSTVHRTDGPCHTDDRREAIALAIARVDAGKWGTDVPLREHPMWQAYLAYGEAVLAMLTSTRKPELRRLAAVSGPVAGEQQNETVAYRNPDRPDVLLCREHGDSWWGLTPLTSEDLPDGGTCTWGMPFEDEVCGRDVLAEPRP